MITESNDASSALSTPSFTFRELASKSQRASLTPLRASLLVSSFSLSLPVSYWLHIAVHCTGTCTPFQPFPLNGSFLIRNKLAASACCQRLLLHVVLPGALWSLKPQWSNPQMKGKQEREKKKTLFFVLFESGIDWTLPSNVCFKEVFCDHL